MITSVIKVGGSLALLPKELRSLCKKLSDLSKQHELVIIPGGGEFADIVRLLDKRFSLSPQICHKMAILGMEQFGFLLSDLIPNSYVFNTLGDLKKVLKSDKLPIFLPSTFMQHENPLKNSWEVTSDSIAVYIASRLDAAKVLLVTDVDGVFTNDPKKFPHAKLINKLSAKQLFGLNERTSVDQFLPKIILEKQLKCYVLNGCYPVRIEAVLDSIATVCTLITP
jgi:5-(aminomethyl)-3-furanmethanol phosphate kinase